ncbi:hypothetical protein EMIT043CA1_50342 [Pseudomonas brassicacearum]
MTPQRLSVRHAMSARVNKNN